MSPVAVSPTIVRRGLNAVCAVGVVGMIATNIADNGNGALAFGLASAVAVLGLLLLTALTVPSPVADVDAADEALGERLEEAVQALVDDGADEAAVRTLVGDAVRLGRRSSARSRREN